MPPPTTPFAANYVTPRLEVLFEEIAELTGQRNAIDGRLVEIIAEIDGDHLWGATGCKSVEALVAWKAGVTPRNAETMVAVARRLDELPRMAEGLRDGRLSLDRVGVIAERAAEGCDDHYANLVQYATVTQLRTAVKMEPRPEPESKPEPQRSFSSVDSEGYTTYKIRLPKLEAAKFDAAVASHKDALIADWRRDHDAGDSDDEQPGALTCAQGPPFPDTTDAFMSLVEAGWDSDVAARPHGAHTTVIAHLDLDRHAGTPVAALHLGPALTDAGCAAPWSTATRRAWCPAAGPPVACTPTIWCTWENGGPTDLSNLVLLCRFHHRLHHNGGITLTGPADQLRIPTATDTR